MADQVEEVKQKTDIVSIISEHVDLKKAGRNYKALCPFHGEKTPSFMVSPELQIFKCFGCGESGDVISFLQKYEGMDFYEALKFLADRAGIRLRPSQNFKKSFKERIYQINYLAAKFYNYILLNHPLAKVALNYLTKQRGLELRTIKTFQLGYSPNRPLALKKFLIDKKKISIDELAKAGLVYQKGSGAYDRFRGRVIFPLHDHRGNIAGFAGRILPSDDNKDLAKYINTPETDAYHKSKILYGLNLTKGDIKRKNVAVIVEGELDMISSWQAGIGEVVAIKGSALTTEQVNLLSRFTQKIVLALDADIAGDVASRRGIEIAEKEGLEVTVARLPKKFKDPDEMARKDPKGLKKSIKNAKGAWDFIIDQIFEKYDNKEGVGKARVSREIVPILKLISDKIVQAYYIELVAKRLKVPIEAVSQEILKKGEEKKDIALETMITEEKKRSRRDLLEERLVAIAFRYDPTVLEKQRVLEIIVSPLARRIVAQFKNFIKKNKFEASKFANYLPPELFEGYSDLILKEINNLRGEGNWEKEIDLIIRELEIIDTKSQLQKVAEKIKKLEKKGKKVGLEKKEKEFDKLTKRLSELEEEDIKGIIL